MSLRDFLRGGVYDIDEPTLVVRRGSEFGVWMPRGQGITAAYYANANTVDPMASASSTLLRSASTTPPVNVEGLNSAIDQLKDYLSRLPETTTAEEEK